MGDVMNVCIFVHHREKKESPCMDCRYRQKDWTNQNNPDHYCRNVDSGNYGENTDNVIRCYDKKGTENEM